MLFPGALVANLTILAFQRKDPNFLEYVITNEEAKDKFSISDTGLLHTKVKKTSLCPDYSNEQLKSKASVTLS